MKRHNRWLVGAFALLVLLTVYLFQRFNYLAFFLEGISVNLSSVHPFSYFIFNKTIRLFLNDGACLLLIIVLFQEKKYVQLATYVFLIELFIILPLYLIIKLQWEGDSEISSPLLSQIHRMIVNPLLMFLLIISFFYQSRISKRV